MGKGQIVQGRRDLINFFYIILLNEQMNLGSTIDINYTYHNIHISIAYIYIYVQAHTHAHMYTCTFPIFLGFY